MSGSSLNLTGKLAELRGHICTPKQTLAPVTGNSVSMFYRCTVSDTEMAASLPELWRPQRGCLHHHRLCSLEIPG